MRAAGDRAAAAEGGTAAIAKAVDLPGMDGFGERKKKPLSDRPVLAVTEARASQAAARG